MRSPRFAARILAGTAITLAVFLFIISIQLDLTPSTKRIKSFLLTRPPPGDSQPCLGPDGRLVENPASGVALALPYPQPAGGSHVELGLSQTWMTANGRYGPYGLGQSSDDYLWPRIDWSQVKWGALQSSCLDRNLQHYPNVDHETRPPKLKLKSMPNKYLDATWERRTRPAEERYNRTAIVVRTWDSYDYQEEDLANLRSLIMETSLDSRAEYEVFLLVHVRDTKRGIFDDARVYQDVLNEVVPAELRDIAVLFDYPLLDSWYPKTPTHVPEFQMFQALQLLAQEADQFDHYWQLEMDVRFTGNVRQFLDSMSSFARREPRRQAWERSTYFYFPEVHGTWAEFSKLVADSSTGDEIWGPVRIPDVEPQGPKPPHANASDDNFEWGVGEDADVIVTHPAKDAELDIDWVYRDWIHHFELGAETPRWVAPPAIARASWNVLNTVHVGQAKKGLALPSEATLPSFALWHGFKLVYPPQPWWMLPAHKAAELDELFNDGPPRPGKMQANGTAKYHPAPYGAYTHHTTWWWGTSFPGLLADKWYRGAAVSKQVSSDLSREESDIVWETDDDTPFPIQAADGQLWMPNVALHPVKTNKNPV